jgi:hypothetical protein
MNPPATPAVEATYPDPLDYYYNEHGYDMRRLTRYVYAFLTEDGERVKIGLVNSELRLDHRLREVTKSSAVPGLRRVAVVAIKDIDGHEAEDVEAAVQLWLNRTKGLRHAGAVDWLFVPDGGVAPEDWQPWLEQAAEAIKNISSIVLGS